MAENRRVKRVEKELRQLVSNFFLTRMNDPAMGLISVSRVVVSPDLRQAKVYISFLQDDPETKADSLEIIDEKKPELQRYIGSNLNTKFCPKLQILEDEGLQHQIKIEKILHEIGQEQSKNKSNESKE